MRGKTWLDPVENMDKHIGLALAELKRASSNKRGVDI